jgi:hypothetical protein
MEFERFFLSLLFLKFAARRWEKFSGTGKSSTGEDFAKGNRLI